MDNTNQPSLRRSLRLKQKSCSLSLNPSAETPNETKALEVKKKISLHHTHEKKGKREILDPSSCGSKQTSKSVQSTSFSAENNIRDCTTIIESIDKEHMPVRSKVGKMKKKQNRSTPRQSVSEKTTKENIRKCPAPSKYEERIVKLEFIKTIRIDQNYHGSTSDVRFTDVAFLDENHVLALDDKWQKPGGRVFCICLNGTTLSDLLLPGYPWSIVILSPTEAVVSIRESGNLNGLLWISIDINAKSTEIIRHLPLKLSPQGLSYMERSGDLLVSYPDQPFMSVLSREGEEIRKIPCVVGVHYRCLVLQNNDILFVNFFANTVCVMNQEGDITLSISVAGPMCLETDSAGNIYVGSVITGDLLKFDRYGKYLVTFHCGLHLFGVGIDRTSERIITAQNDSLFVYKLDTNI